VIEINEEEWQTDADCIQQNDQAEPNASKAKPTKQALLRTVD